MVMQRQRRAMKIFTGPSRCFRAPSPLNQRILMILDALGVPLASSANNI